MTQNVTFFNIFAGWLAYYSWCWVWKWVSVWYQTSFPWHLCFEIFGIVAHSIHQYGHKFFFWENWLSSDEITGMVSKNSTACEELASKIFLWTMISGTHTYRWYLYRRQAMYNFLWLGIRSNLVDREFWNEHDNSGEQSYYYTHCIQWNWLWLMWLFYFQTPTFCDLRHWQGSLHCISNLFFT